MARLGCGLLATLFLALFPALAGSPYPGGAEVHAGSDIRKDVPRPYRLLGIDRSTVGSLRLIRIRALMLKGPEQTWMVLDDVERWPEFFHLFSEIRPVETSGELRRYRFSVRPPWPMADFDSVVLVRSSPQERQILWNIEEGALAGMFGRILVLEASLEQGSEVVYESFGSAGKRFPAWVVKIGLHIVLPGVLRQLSERLQAQFPKPAEKKP